MTNTCHKVMGSVEKAFTFHCMQGSLVTSFLHNTFLPSVCGRGKRITGFCFYSILYLFSHNTSTMSRKPKHIKCLYRTWENKFNFPQNITQKRHTLLYGSGKCKGLLFVWRGYCCLKNFCDEILKDTLLMASHSFNGITQAFLPVGQTSCSVS